MKNSLLFSKQEILFSTKSFSAAMLALFIAFYFGQQRPFWAMMTAYIVAQPIAAYVRSKSFYRGCGTLIGCAAVVLFIPSLANSPELLCLSIALWIAFCLYQSLKDRSASSYMLLLGGYSVAIIGFPLVDSPLSAIEVSIARISEIGIGLACACLVHSIFFPVSIGSSMFSLADGSLDATRKLIHSLLKSSEGQHSKDVSLADLKNLSRDITQLLLMSAHISFDTTNLRYSKAAITNLHSYLAELIPTISSIKDRLDALIELDAHIADEVLPAIQQLSVYFSDSNLRPVPDGAIKAIRSIEETQADVDWIRAIRLDLVTRLSSLASIWNAALDIRQQINSTLLGVGESCPQQAMISHKILYVDRKLAAISVITAVLSIFLSCGVWIATAWPFGFAMAMSSAVFCCFFASLNDPVPAMNKFTFALLWSLPLSALCVLGIIPIVHDFGMLLLCIFPLFFVIGCYLARPVTSLKALGIFFGVAGTLALQDTGTSDFLSFISTHLALFAGALIAGQLTSIFRTVGESWIERHLINSTQEDVKCLLENKLSFDPRAYFTSRTLDRIAQLPSIGQHCHSACMDSSTHRLFQDLATGIDLIVLHQNRKLFLEDEAKIFIDEVQTAILSKETGNLTATLPNHIDGLLGKYIFTDEMRPLISSLVGLRRNLFPRIPLTFPQ